MLKSWNNWIKAVVTTALAAILLMATACQGQAVSGVANPNPDGTVHLQIFAANSLETALPMVQALYVSKHPDVSFADSQFKASGDLIQQITAGADCDILIAASDGSMDTAATNGRVDSQTRVELFSNDLVVIKAMGSKLAVNSLDIVRDPAVTRIAVGDSAVVPAGQYANQALFSMGLYSSLSGQDGKYDTSIANKMVLADKAGTVSNYVANGDCQIGFAYSSDLYRYQGISIAYQVPPDCHQAIRYPGAVTINSQYPKAAADFLAFCQNDPDALKIWSEYGFQVL